MSYHITKKVSLPFEDALSRVIEALKIEGFGVITEIDIKETLKKKLNIDYKKYKILGACIPQLSYQALSTEPAIGVLLPCNVVVYEDTQDHTVVSAVDPERMFGIVGRDDVSPIAVEVAKRINRVVDNIS
jgi:uncharacterized protein (DUF302 family)